MGSIVAPEDLFHVGIVVADLERSIDHLAREGYTFTEPVRGPLAVLDPAGRPVSAEGLLNYSKQEPRIELLQARAGTPWDPAEVGGIHHLGYWVDDLAAGLAAARDAGYTVEWTGAGDDGQPARFAYARVPGAGTRIELVDRSVIGAHLERWWAGEAYRR